MSEKVTQIVLGSELDRNIDEVLEMLRQKNPERNWSRDELIKVAVGRGLSQLFRQHQRKCAQLSGVYLKTSTEDSTDNDMTVENLSVGGIGFRTSGPHLVRQSEILHVAFILSDADRTVIARRVLVIHVHERYVGAKFCESDDYNGVAHLNQFLAS